jgi:hypothetical protein
MHINHRPGRERSKSKPFQPPARGVDVTERQFVKTFFFVFLGEGGPLDRSRVDDPDRTPHAIRGPRQNLPAVNMPRQYRVKPGRQIIEPHDILTVAEGVIRRPYPCAFDRLMKTEQFDITGRFFPAGLLQDGWETVSNVVPFERKPGQTHPRISDPKRERRRFDKNVDIGVAQIQRRGQTGAFVIAGDDDDRDAPVGEPVKSAVRQIDDPGRDAASEEQIAPVNDQIHPGFRGVVQHPVKIIEKIRPPAPALDSRPYGVIETKMGIGEQYYSSFIF